MGGITLAARLARRGLDVTVVEKNPAPGGRVARLRRDGFTFDMGPTLLLMPWEFRRTYAELGYSFEERVPLKRIDPHYRFYFHDNSTMDSTPDIVALGARMEEMEPGSTERLMHFMEVSGRHYRLSLKHMVGRNFYSLPEFLSPKNLPLLWKLHTYQSHASFTERHFHDPRLQAAFSYQNMYMGLSAWDAPATYSFLQYIELAEGIWIPEGGYYAIAEDLTAIGSELGVRWMFDTEVKRIETADDDGPPDRPRERGVRNGVRGVRLADGSLLEADLVVTNADLPYAYQTLLDDQPTWRQLRKQRFTNSCFMFYWGVDGADLSPLAHHTAFLSDHVMKESFDEIFRDFGVPAEPSFYVNIPSRTDPGMAPAGADAMTILVPIGYIDEDHPQDWEAEQARVREYVLSRLASVGADVRGHIRFEETLTPEKYRTEWNLARGAAFGFGHRLRQMGYLRPHNRHRKYDNLYFVGAGTHPGTGVPLVMISARLVEERLVHDGFLPSANA